MPTNTSLTIHSLDNNSKKVTNKISYVNPNITDRQALEFTQAISALTNDSYQSTERTDTTNISNDLRATYPNPQIKGVSSATSSIAYINITDNNKANLLITQACVGLQVSVQSIEFLWSIATSNADAFNRAPYFKDITSTDGVDRALVQRNQSSTRWQFFLGGGTEKPAVGTVIKATLCLDGNAFYKDAEWDLTITVVGTEE